MVRDGRGVSARLLLLLGLVVTGFAYLGLRIWTGQGLLLPQASWGALIVLVFMACGVFFAGLPVRRFLRGQAKKSLNPMRAMRTLVLAQAAALTGALVAGWYLAQVLVVLPDFDIASRRTLVVRLAALAAGGILMAIAGLAAQSMCRVDKGGDDDYDDDGDGGNNGTHNGRHNNDNRTD
jgi:Na+/proline symporter